MHRAECLTPPHDNSVLASVGQLHHHTKEALFTRIHCIIRGMGPPNGPRFQNTSQMMGRGRPPMRGGPHAPPPFLQRGPPGRGPPIHGGGRFMGGRMPHGRPDMIRGGFNGRMNGRPIRGGHMNHRGPPPPPPPPMHMGRGRGAAPPPPPPPRRGGPPPHHRPLNSRPPHQQVARVNLGPGRFGQSPIPNGSPNGAHSHHMQRQPPAAPPHPVRAVPQPSYPHNVQHLSANFPKAPIHSYAPPAAVPTPSAAAPASVWSEQTAPNGTKFYYNSVTKASVWEKPVELGGTLQKQPVPAQQTAKQKPWVEYTDAATGKKYYSNGTTTTWEKPGNSTDTTAVADTAKDEVPENPRKKQKKARETEFSSKEEAVAAFKGLMIAKDVTPSSKWNELVKLYSSDSRWEACEDVLTTGERKQALAEYQTKRANELRMIERQEKVRAREAFTELLKDVLPKMKLYSAWNTCFADVRDQLARDDRFHTVADEATRESLFLDFCEEFRKREERKKRSVRREAQDNFNAFLREREEEGLLTFATTWNSFLSSLDDTGKTDTRFVTSPVLSDSERQLYFADFVIDLQQAEDDKRRRIEDARRRAEEAQRDGFRDFLQKLARDGNKIFPWSRWREVESVLVSDSSYGPLREQDSEAPRRLFEDFIDEWYQRYRRDRVLLGKLIRPASQTELVVTAETRYETFAKALLESAASSTDLFNDANAIINRSEPVSSARIYFSELQSKGPPTRTIGRRGSTLCRVNDGDSSEDEGEIKEDYEVSGEDPSPK